jgi:pimeloyl-ACP methyl ester carboxylesterase
MMRLHQIRLLPLLFLCGCIHFQEGRSEPLKAEERLAIAGRGQLRVIDRHPDGAAPILLVHGYGASTASYAPVLDELAAQHRVIAVDLPGFGSSDRLAGDYSPGALADVLVEILDQKKVGKVHLVGHSWGASVALAFALRHPDRLERLVLISGWVYDDQLLPVMRWSRVPVLGEILYALFYREATGEKLYLNFYDPKLVTEKMVDEVERHMAREGTLAAALAAARGMRFAERDYPKVAAETLLLWGREDRVARLGFGERLARELPHARLVVFPRCGHIPMLECRGETAGALREFLGAF